MLTDSGGYQIFSMGHGSVSNEIKGKRGADGVSINSYEQSLLKIDEKGATFRSYVDDRVLELTPERSIEIQRKLGADLIVVLDECTPFNVEKKYTVDSMERSHRWALRSLAEFQRLEQNPKYNGRQALYGIVQGGVYRDLRDVSCAFVNDHDFFGTAIGGSLGASRREMHEIVSYTRSKCRDDRPVHLLGIGGVRDVFHGVRQGVDTFDCVHPSRLARHGGALVMAAHWGEEVLEGEVSPLEQEMVMNRWKKLVSSTHEAQIAHYHALSPKHKMALKAALSVTTMTGVKNRVVSRAILRYREPQYDQARFRDLCCDIADHRGNALVGGTIARSSHSVAVAECVAVTRPTKAGKKRRVKEHIHITNAEFRSDPRPIDSSCGCYTCRTFSRAYLHHLFKAGESTGGTLVRGFRCC